MNLDRCAIINLVAHDIVILNQDKSVKRIYPKSKIVLRCVEEYIPKLSVDRNGVKICFKQAKYSHPLPEIDLDTFYIVSRSIARATKRTDFLVVDKKVRDRTGNILGCYCLTSLVHAKGMDSS